jgi:ribulose-phosphate 3-epimerase
MIIAPSLLAANFGRLASEIQRVDRAGADRLHLDIMDGHFVPNISFGPEVVRVARPLTKLFLEAHLMCSKPEILLEPFVKNGVDHITIHVELGDRVLPLLWQIKSFGKQVGLALNPSTPIQAVEPFLAKIDLLLIMTVNPGFGGQPFIAEMLPKIQQATAWRAGRKLSYRIEVDGGIDFVTCRECAAAGADAFVSGTALFSRKNLRAAITKMRAVLRAYKDRAH